MALELVVTSMIGLLLVVLSVPGVATARPATWSESLTSNRVLPLDSHLNGVSCTAVTSCVAVGYYLNASGVAQTLVEIYNGATWSITPSPMVSGSTGDYLNGVSCTSASFCVAAGDYWNASGALQTLVETYDGATWSIIPTPIVSGITGDVLIGVSCTSASFCVAVANYSNASSVHRTLIETSNGKAW